VSIESLFLVHIKIEKVALKILAVVNPISGGVDKEPFMSHFKSEMENFGIDYETFYTTGKNDDENLKKSISDFEPDRIASVGGDGTTLFTACNLMASKIPFGIMPLGSANGMAAELGVDNDPKNALSDFLKSHTTCPLDLVLVNDEHYCLHIGDVGINANIVEDFTQDKGRGMASYAKHFIDRVVKKELIKCSIEADGKTYEQNGYMVAIANSRKYGTGVVLNYVGDPTDGKFEVVVLNEIDSKTLMKAGLSKFNEEMSKENNVTIISCNEVLIKFDKPHMLQLDGELIGKVSALSGKIVSSAVQLVTSKKNPFVN
jgi:diacylglycerol kinase family enzyme